MATKEHVKSYEELKINFFHKFWSKISQSHTAAQIYRCRCDNCTDGSVASHLMNYALLATALQSTVSELEVIKSATSSHPP